MATNERSRQKKLAKQKAKKREAAKKGLKNIVDFMAGQAKQASTAPIHDCLMNEDLFEDGIGSMILSRRLPDGDIAIGMFLIDAFCLGVKNAHFMFMAPREYTELISQIREHEDLVGIEPSCFRRIVEGAAIYGKKLGFSPHEDYKETSKIFGNIKSSDCTEEFEFGDEGKPLFIAGPYDSPQKCKKIIDTLTKSCGEGNFDYVLPTDIFDDDEDDDGDYEDDDDDYTNVPSIPDRRLMERITSKLGKLLSQKDFKTTEEANEFLKTLKPGDMPEVESETPLEKAQDLMYEAFEAKGNRRIQLAREALKISEDCADAYVLLAEEAANTKKEAKEFYEKGVEAGRRALTSTSGENVFEEDAGHFWGMIETRPFMRAMHGLANMSWATDEKDRAIEIYQEMLRLNTNDNQGVRYQLITYLLELNRDEEAEKLLDKYEDDASATWDYSRALLTFKKEGGTSNANSLLKEAIKTNHFVPDYLTGNKRFPRVSPPYYSFGDENEAIHYAYEGKNVWQKVSGAIEWLQENIRKR
jgi:tetratricopeptide (TPR) repeat protein